MSSKTRIICVIGPTASGKTALGVDLAKALNGEVVSADSMQIYKGMHIASAAPDSEEMKGIKHHLLEFLPYGSVYSVYDWVKAAREIINDMAKRRKTPVIVGGTGLYVNCLIDNIKLTESETDLALRESLMREAEEKGGAYLLEKLRKIDSKAAEKLHENDIKRIVRCLEIYKTSGLTPTEQNELSKREESPYDAVVLGINFLDRQKLYDRINKRVDIMLNSGLEKEARVAFDNKTEHTAGAAQAIGHKELFPYFEGEISLLEAAENLKRATRRYAKRQLTWFNARNDINWIYADGEKDVLESALEIIKRTENNEGTQNS